MGSQSNCWRAALVVAVALAGLWLLPLDAHAQEGRGGPVGVRFDVHLTGGPWYNWFGAGFRVDIPIVEDGLIDGTDDDLSLTVGGDALWLYHRVAQGFGVIPVLALQWNFYLNETWSIFPELGVAFLFIDDYYHHRYWDAWVGPYVGFGARLHFNPRNALLFRISWPTGAQIGITF